MWAILFHFMNSLFLTAVYNRLLYLEHRVIRLETISARG